ncbi:MAG: SDR family NAD(P)-dependent oxidoreductase, partial [Spartobacteria bacterium]|nr:SDR family NAD(P)-dependent oxidoreductase [Spartobacteria bacterium]
MNLRGKTVLVTGGAVRIGKAMCAALAAEGMRVLIHCNKSLDEARMLCGDIEQSGQTAWVLNACLETREDGLRLMARARESAGPVDVLINNASVFLPDTLSTLAPDVMERQLRVNCWVPMYLTQAFAAQPGASGHVINMLDQRICRHDPGYLSYTASKKALAEFTCAAAQDLAPAIRVNAIAPGAVLPP